MAGTSAAFGSLQQSAAPNITGKVGNLGTYNSTIAEGCFTTAKNGNNVLPNSGTTAWTATFDASKSSSIYGRSTDLYPANYSVQFFIKY